MPDISIHNKYVYQENFRLAASQNKSFLWPLVTHTGEADGMGRGEVFWFDTIGTVEMQPRVTLHADTPVVAVPAYRRGMVFDSWDIGHLLDEHQLLKVIANPTNIYAMRDLESAWRRVDKTIINGMLGSVLTQSATGTPGAGGVIGTSALPAAQMIWADATDVSDGTPNAASGKNLNMKKFRRAITKFKLNNVTLNGTAKLSVAIPPQGLQQMMASVKTTSRDFNDAAADRAAIQQAIVSLRTGQYTELMGVTIVEMNGLPQGTTDSPIATPGANIVRCVMWDPARVYAELPIAPRSRIDQAPEKRYDFRIYSDLAVGAARAEDVGVVGIDIDVSVVDVEGEG